MTITLNLPDAVENALRSEAERRGLTTEEVALERIASAPSSEASGLVRHIRTFPRGSGRSDTSSRVDELLEEEGFGQ